MKSFKRMVIVSSMLLMSLLLAASYAEQWNGNSEISQEKVTPAEQVDIAEAGYAGLVTGIQLQLFH